MDPYSKVDYSLIVSEASMAMKKTSSGDSPPDLGPTTVADRDIFLEN
jgi:hypothetical protein